MTSNGLYTPILRSVSVTYEDSTMQPTYSVLTVDSTPVKGDCFINSTYLGVAPQARSVVNGVYVVSWGDVAGYTTPASQVVNVTEDTLVTGTYEQIVTQQTYLLKIYSNPIIGFRVEVSNSTDTYQIYTGSLIALTEGEYNITVVETNIEITFEQWYFSSWSDGNTNPTRTIQLSKDTILLYYYTK